MIPQQTINEYNQKTAIIVITSYPPKGSVYGEGVGGVASFAKNTLKPLALSGGRKYIVLAEILDKPDVYIENNILVIRCWRRNSFKFYKDNWAQLRKFNQVKLVMMEFEFALYGDFVVASFIPLYLTLLKAQGRKVIIVCHQVTTNLNKLSGHLGLKKKSLQIYFFSKLMRLVYRWLAFASHKIVVLEDTFAKRLINLGINPHKIKVIPHGVDLNLRLMKKSEARKKLQLRKNAFVVLCFGFLTWYKGSDLVAKAIAKIPRDRDVILLLAGGRSMTQQSKPFYKNYYSRLNDIVAREPRVYITGFVKESEIRTYYSAADLVVLPYRVYMSSSGPLSLALSFHKPFILSKPLKKWLGRYQGVPGIDSLIFEPKISALAEKIEFIAAKKKVLRCLALASEKIAQKRNYVRLAQKYREVFDEVEKQ